MIRLRFAVLVLCFTVLFLNQGQAQRFKAGPFVGFTSIKYAFPEKSDPYDEADIKPFGSATFGAGFQYQLSKAFRMGTGVQYLKASGQRDGMYVSGSPANPNSSGDLTVQADNAYLLFPFEFIVSPFTKLKVQPIFTAGLNFFKPLKEKFVFDVDPENPPNEFYPLVHGELGEGSFSEYRGYVIGTGVLVPVGETGEIMLRLNYRNNNVLYQWPQSPSRPTGKRGATMDMLDFSLGYYFGF